MFIFKSDLDYINDVSSISLDDCGIEEFANFSMTIYQEHEIILKFKSDICEIYTNDIRKFIHNINQNIDASLKFDEFFILYSNNSLLFSVKKFSSLFIAFKYENNVREMFNKLLDFSIKYDELYRINSGPEEIKNDIY